MGSLVNGLMFTTYSWNYFHNIVEATFFFAAVLPFGFFYGGIAGISCGVPMYFITRQFIKNRYSVTAYRVYVGYLTTVISGIIFLPAIFGSLFIAYFGQPIFLFGMFCSVGIAVYCSQLTIAKYLRETDVRKRKHKVK